MNKPVEPLLALRRQAYRKAQPWGMAADMMVPDALTSDDKLWAPVAPDIWSRPLHLNPNGSRRKEATSTSPRGKPIP